MTERRSTYQHASWANLAPERLGEGIERRKLVGDRLMICRLRFDPHVVTPVHRHPHEQVTLVERGRVRFIVGGEERIAVAGDVLHFPSNVEHGATMLEDEVVLVDIFTPIREEFLQKTS